MGENGNSYYLHSFIQVNCEICEHQTSSQLQINFPLVSLQGLAQLTSISVAVGNASHCITCVMTFVSVKMALMKQSAVSFPSYKEIIESFRMGKKLLRSPSPTINPALPNSLIKHVPQCYIYF